MFPKNKEHDYTRNRRIPTTTLPFNWRFEVKGVYSGIRNSCRFPIPDWVLIVIPGPTHNLGLVSPRLWAVLHKTYTHISLFALNSLGTHFYRVLVYSVLNTLLLVVILIWGCASRRTFGTWGRHGQQYRNASSVELWVFDVLGNRLPKAIRLLF